METVIILLQHSLTQLRLGPNEFYAQLFQYIRSRNASEEDVRFVENQLRNGRTEHTTSSSDERKKLDTFVRNNTYVMSYLVKMYFYDFLLFGFKVPDIAVDEKINI